MQIVIDIPEEVREHIFDLANDGNEIPLGINAHMVKAIVNGTPLPKEHDEINAVFDKIRAEIEALPKTYPFINHIDTYVKEDDVKRIIDKYRNEVSE